MLAGILSSDSNCLKSHEITNLSPYFINARPVTVFVNVFYLTIRLFALSFYEVIVDDHFPS